MELLDNTIQPYAWGSRTAIAQLQRRAVPSAEPEAELWMGSHPRGPSRIRSDSRLLSELIADDPQQLLGSDCVNEFGDRLPFLLKVLASQSPLSIQVHPSTTQAQAGFARENAQGIPLNSSTRHYVDDKHKPELICALEDFWCLYGFRSLVQTRQLWQPLVETVPDFTRPLFDESNDSSLSAVGNFFAQSMALSDLEKKKILSVVIPLCHDLVEPDNPYAWVISLDDSYPEDFGVLAPLFLNLVHLTAGQGLYIPDGQLHSYLQGVGVEIMASSDNVLRGGLTPKYIDIDELLAVIDCQSHSPRIVPRYEYAPGIDHWPTPAREFSLHRYEVSLQYLEHRIAGSAPHILIATHGDVQLVDEVGSSLILEQGQSVFLAAGENVTMKLVSPQIAYVFAASIPLGW